MPVFIASLGTIIFTLGVVETLVPKFTADHRVLWDQSIHRSPSRDNVGTHYGCGLPRQV